MCSSLTRRILCTVPSCAAYGRSRGSSCERRPGGSGSVLGAWNAVTRTLVSVTNTTVVNTDTMCELLRKIAALGLTGPISLVLDNARYQRNAVVMTLAQEPGITLMFLPSYSPNLNLSERLWKFTKRRCLGPLSSRPCQLSSGHRTDAG